jgi:hypothetical protein
MITEHQKKRRDKLFLKNRERLYRKKYRLDEKIDFTPIDDIVHKTDPAYINNNELKYTLCGMDWSPNVSSSLIIKSDVTCPKCREIIRDTETDNVERYFMD